MQKIKKSCYTFSIDSTDCIFCQIDIKFRHNVVWDSALFWIIYDGFPITDPHLLIIPKAHVLCYGQLAQDQFPHLESLMETIEQKIKKPLLFFEHGDIGQTVKHAHLHAIPFDGDVDAAISVLDIPGRKEPISNTADISRYQTYLLFIKPNEEMAVFLPDADVAFGPAPITNALAKFFGKPTPAANRPPPSPAAITAVQNIFLESSHGS